MSKSPRAAPGTSSIELTAALESARADLEAAEAAIEVATEQYETHLLTDAPAESRARLDVKTDAGIAVDRCKAIIRQVERHLAAALETEAAAHRADLVAVAKKKTAAAQKRLQAEYPVACEQIRSLLRDIAEADQAVLDANGAAVEGEAHLPFVESFRELPTQFRQDMSTRRVTLWCAAGSPDQPLSPDEQRRVHVDGRRATVPTESGSRIPVEQQTFDVVEYLQHENGIFPTSLAASIALPALGPAEGDYWTPLDGAAAFAVLRQLDEPRRPPATLQPREPIAKYSVVRI